MGVVGFRSDSPVSGLMRGAPLYPTYGLHGQPNPRAFQLDWGEWQIKKQNGSRLKSAAGMTNMGAFQQCRYGRFSAVPDMGSFRAVPGWLIAHASS